MGPQTPQKAPDGGWGWVVLAGSCLCNFLAFGSLHSVGVLYPEWLDTFQEGKGLTAWVGSVASGAGLIASPICSACVIYFGARLVMVFGGAMMAGGFMLSAFAPNVSFLIFSYGVIAGVGCGLIYAANVTLICHYFDKRRGKALGVLTTGASVGGFLYGTVQNKLVEVYGLEGCLLLVGAFTLNIVALAGLMRPLQPSVYHLKQRAALEPREGKTPPSEDPVAVETKDPPPPVGERRRPLLLLVAKATQRAYGEYSRSAGRYLRDRLFAALCVSILLFMLGSSPPLLFMEDVARSRGLAQGVAAVPLVSVVAVSTALGKLALGALADLRGVSSARLYGLTLLGTGLALLLVPACHSYALLQVLSAALGFFSGNGSITPYVTTKLVGLPRLTEAFGFLMFFGGLGTMLGPPVIGWLSDWTRAYDVAFFFSGGCVLLGGLLVFLCALPRWGQKTAEDSCRPEIAGDCDQVASVA